MQPYYRPADHNDLRMKAMNQCVGRVVQHQGDHAAIIIVILYCPWCHPPYGHSAGQQYYEDLCMKAVNQCVGRVIRHQRDHAAINIFLL